MKNKTKIIAGVVVLALLAAAFWYGGGAPGLHGWKAANGPEQTAANPADTAEENAETDPSAGTVPADEISGEVEENAAAGDAETAEEAEAEPSPNAEPAESSGETAPTAAEEPAARPEETAPSNGPEAMDINPATGLDKYNTSPVPEGKPAPVEPQDVTVTDVPHSCTISIRCDTILNHMDWLDPEKVELVPADGVILAPVSVTFYEGESVFNVLQRTCKQNAIHMEFENTPMYNSAYIEGIHNLYEFDCGELSGWMYSVNGWFPNYGCSRYALQEGDVISWVYTCDLGYDVGGGYAIGN